MLLLIIRHAIAETREAPSVTSDHDSLRPLTAKGRRRMAAAAIGVRRLLPELNLLAASPLVRARQTAEIIATAYGSLPIVTTSSLEPESAPVSFLTWLRAQRGESVAVVGHEPHVGILVTWLLTGVEESRVSFRKGGACLLEFATRPRRGEARLLWALTPAQLRRIGR